MAVVPPVSAPAASPDPKAAMPAGDWLMVQGAPASTPMRAGTRTSQARATAVLGGPKPLRSPKSRIERATQIDPEAELAAGQAAAPVAHAPRSSRAGASPAAAATCVPLAAAFQVGEDDNTSIPPDTHAAASKTHVFAPHNNNVSIFDRAGAFISRTSLNTFWQGVGITGHTFDPKVVFDASTDRFYFVAITDVAAAHRLQRRRRSDATMEAICDPRSIPPRKARCGWITPVSASATTRSPWR